MDDKEPKVKKIIIPHVCGIFYTYDGCIEIISQVNHHIRLMLFYPPGFSLFIPNYLITWNVDKKLWFDVWKHDFDRRREEKDGGTHD